MSPSQAHRVEGEAISSELRQEVAHRVSDDNQDDHDGHGGNFHDGNGHDDGDRVEGQQSLRSSVRKLHTKYLRDNW